MLKQKGIVTIRNKINGHVNVQEVSDCFSCKDVDYRIISINGNIIRDFKNCYDIGNRYDQKYLIEFFDDADYDHIEEYLQNDDSDYRLTRLKDQVVMRLSHEDRKKAFEDQEKIDKKYEHMLDYFIEEECLEIKKELEKKTGKIKRLIKKITSR